MSRAQPKERSTPTMPKEKVAAARTVKVNQSTHATLVAKLLGSGDGPVVGPWVECGASICRR